MRSNEQSSVSYTSHHQRTRADYGVASSDDEGYEHALTIARLESELAEIIQSVIFTPQLKSFGKVWTGC